MESFSIDTAKTPRGDRMLRRAPLAHRAPQAPGVLGEVPQAEPQGLRQDRNGPGRNPGLRAAPLRDRLCEMAARTTQPHLKGNTMEYDHELQELVQEAVDAGLIDEKSAGYGVAQQCINRLRRSAS